MRAVDRRLIDVVRSLGGGEWDLYRKVLLPSVLPFVVAAARIAIGRALIGVLVGEFFAASEGIGFAISRYGDLFAIDKMFACILVVMVIAVVLTEGIRFAERSRLSLAGGAIAMAELASRLFPAAPAEAARRRDGCGGASSPPRSAPAASSCCFWCGSSCPISCR